MKKALIKDLWMEIRRSKARFLSIFFIVALGVAFFSGIQAASPDMRFSGSDYYKEAKLMDLKVIGSMGLQEEDVEALSAIDGIEYAEGSYFADVLCGDGANVKVLHMEALSEAFNLVSVQEGRLPRESGECFLDASYASGNEIRLGDVLNVREAGEESFLLKNQFTVVGIGQSPLYISFNRGNTTLGSGEINGFAFLLPEDFKQEVFTQIYIKVHGTEQVISYTDAYESLVDRMKDAVEALEKERCEVRLASVKEEAMEELQDGIREYRDGEKEAMEELLDAEKKLADGEQEYLDGVRKFRQGEFSLAWGNQQLTYGREQLEAGKKELEDGRNALNEAKSQLSTGQNTLNANQSEVNAGWKELTDAQEQLSAGEQELTAGKKKLEDSKTELASGKAQLEQGKLALQSGKDQLSAGKAQLETARQELTEKQEELDAGWQELRSGQAQLLAGRQTLEETEGELSGQKTLLQEGLGSVSSSEEELAAGWAELNAGKESLAEQRSQLEAAYASELLSEEEYLSQSGVLAAAEEAAAGKETELSTASGVLAAKRAELEEALGQVEAGLLEISRQREALDVTEAELAAAEVQLTEGQSQADAGWEQIAQKEKELEAAETEIQTSEAEIAASEKELEKGELEVAAAEAKIQKSEEDLKNGKKEIDENQKKLNAAQLQIDSAQTELSNGAAEISGNENKLLDGEREITDSEKKIAESEKELLDGEEALKDAKADLHEGFRELAEGFRELKKGKAEAAQKLNEAEEEIADGKKKIMEIDLPEWYISTRNDLPEYSDYGDNADRIRNLGKVFPFIFFLVAALISLTTMTRMVEDQRTQIGTKKALGYGMMDIAAKYIVYALFATLGGSVLGVLIGEKIIPLVIIKGYGIMYHNVANNMVIDYEYKFAFLALGTALFCTVGAALFSCYRELTETPASLMRPPAPKEGKRIFLEYLPFLWKRMNFTWKSSMRNLFRYKKRFFMTIFGIAGSMGLMLVGFGIHDSIMDVALIQYADLQHYDGTIILDEEASEEERLELQQYLEADEKIERYSKIMLSKMTATNGVHSLSAYVYVPEDLEKFKEDVTLKNRITDEPYVLTEDGAAICEKTADLLGLKTGDVLTLRRDNKDYKVPVSVITENYMGHYVYLTPGMYRAVFDQNAEYGSIVFTVKDGYKDSVEEAGSELLTCSAALSISYTASLAGQIDRMLTALNMVVVVLIVSAGMLSFVVLYNLNNINITERQRELATLKVLGFYDGEVSIYVFRENMILTVLGIGAGVFFGIFLHRYTITTVEVDAVMFGRNIQPVSFLYCAVLTAGFSLVVNLFMHGKLKKIDMVESLKSVE